MSYSAVSRIPASGSAVEACTGRLKAELTAPSAQPLATGFTIGLPLPPSVNRFVLKLGNKSPVVHDWIKQCDLEILMMRPKPVGIKGPFELHIIWNERKMGRFDIDNRVKPLQDWLQRVELIENDKLCRRLLVEWGPASLGCIVRAKPWSGA